MGAGFPLCRVSLGPSQRCSLPILIHAHHWRAFAITFSAQGTLMMRKPRLDGHLRIIGMPRRSVAKYGGGLPMMRFAQRSCVYRIIGMSWRRPSSFGGGLPMMRLSQQGVLYHIIGMPFVHIASSWHVFFQIRYTFSIHLLNLLFS